MGGGAIVHGLPHPSFRAEGVQAVPWDVRKGAPIQAVKGQEYQNLPPVPRSREEGG